MCSRLSPCIYSSHRWDFQETHTSPKLLQHLLTMLFALLCTFCCLIAYFFFSDVSNNRLKAMCDYQQTTIKARKTFAVNFRTSTFT